MILIPAAASPPDRLPTTGDGARTSVTECAVPPPPRRAPRGWLRLLAIAVVIAAVSALAVGVHVATSPRAGAMPTVQVDDQRCIAAPLSAPTCYRVESDGTWTRLEWRNGQWVPAAILTRP